MVLGLYSYDDHGIRAGTHADFILSLAVTSQKIYFEMMKDYSMIVIRNFFGEGTVMITWNFINREKEDFDKTTLLSIKYF